MCKTCVWFESCGSEQLWNYGTRWGFTKSQEKLTEKWICLTCKDNPRDQRSRHTSVEESARIIILSRLIHSTTFVGNSTGTSTFFSLCLPMIPDLLSGVTQNTSWSLQVSITDTQVSCVYFSPLSSWFLGLSLQVKQTHFCVCFSCDFVRAPSCSIATMDQVTWEDRWGINGLRHREMTGDRHGSSSTSLDLCFRAAACLPTQDNVLAIMFHPQGLPLLQSENNTESMKRPQSQHAEASVCVCVCTHNSFIEV